MLAPQAARQPACTPEWHTYTHCYPPPTPSPCNLQPKSQRERFSMCTAKQHLISQLKGWLAQRWLRPSLCPTRRTAVSSCWPWALSWLSLSPLPPIPSLLFISCIPPFLSPYPPPFCTAPLCSYPVLPHSQRDIMRQIAGSRRKEGGRKVKWRVGGWVREGGCRAGKLPLCLQAISYSLGCRWNLIPTAFTCQVWLLASLIK